MDAVSDTVDRAAKLTGQLLAFARRQALKPETFEVGDCLRGVADMVDTVTGARIHVTVDLPDGACFIHCDRSQFEKDIIELIENAEQLTAANTGLTVVMAMNYGGRNDILQAASRWAQDCAAKGIAPTFDAAEEFMPSFLYTNGMPDPDILIRTSGEQRISNFLLWQCAYSEFVFTQTRWPDFAKADLEAAIAEFHSRDRRFGKIKAS